MIKRGGNLHVRPLRTVLSSACVAIMSLPVIIVGSTGPAAASPAPLTIALITSLTGEAGSSFVGSPAVFKARLDLANAQGGVNGHKLVPLVIDDQTSPAAISTGVQEAISRGAVGIVADSAVYFLGDKFAQQAGIPVTGNSTDGPEWGEQPFTNMFSSDRGSIDPKFPVNTLPGKMLKTFGGTVLGTYGYGISPSSAASALNDAKSFEHAGEKVGVLNQSVPFGSADFTSDALIAKQNGVNALWPGLTEDSDFALANAYKDAGIKLKAAVFPAGYAPALINSPSWSTVQGDYFVSFFRPFSLPDAGTHQMQSALEKYAGFTKSQFPTFGQYEAWTGADLMIKGIQLAGSHPSSSGVIKALRGVKSYNANGLLPITVNYSTVFGTDPPFCLWFMHAQKNGFVPFSSQPECGSDLAGTTTIGSS